MLDCSNCPMMLPTEILMLLNSCCGFFSYVVMWWRKRPSEREKNKKKMKKIRRGKNWYYWKRIGFKMCKHIYLSVNRINTSDADKTINLFKHWMFTLCKFLQSTQCRYRKANMHTKYGMLLYDIRKYLVLILPRILKIKGEKVTENSIKSPRILLRICSVGVYCARSTLWTDKLSQKWCAINIRINDIYGVFANI